MRVKKLNHLQSEHWEQELLPGADRSSASPQSETWMGLSELWHSPAPSSTQILSICHSAKPAGQMDTHTTLLKTSTKPSSYKLYVWPRLTRHTTEVRGGVSCFPTKETLELPMRCIRSQTIQPAESSAAWTPLSPFLHDAPFFFFGVTG